MTASVSSHDTPDATTALLNRLVANLDLGFEELVRCYERTIFSTALRITGSTTEAEDLTSECFLRAFRALRDYPAGRTLALQPKAWLMTILLNTWRNRIREVGRRVNEVSMAELPERAHPERSVEEQILSGESAREMNRLLSALPAAQRSAILLRHVLGLPIAEVSRVMNCPEGTAKSHVSRGMTTLRDLYSYASRRPAQLVPAEIRGVRT
jgi:RNA polymerase sigma-70 factor (ECF subfamily)